jgi:uncharacterized protein (DUF2461 family)
MTRIYRDIRFSKDKSPYRTSIAAQFWHALGKEGMTPGYSLLRRKLSSAVVWDTRIFPCGAATS